MRISINLASQPYVELRPVYTRLRTWMAILALVGVALWFLYRMENRQAQEAVAQVTTIQNRVIDLENQQQRYRAMMQEPHNAAILKQADFLNGLFRRKSFSWTATMEDLENVLPSGVQVLSIDPVIAKDGHVTIRLRVTGARDRALDLLRALEESKHFASPRLAAETLATTNSGQEGRTVAEPVSDTNQVNFYILADYRPLPLKTAAPKAKAEAAKKTAEAGKPAVGKPAAKAPEGRRARGAKPSAGAPHGRRP